MKPSRKKKKTRKLEFIWRRFPANSKKLKLNYFTMNGKFGPDVPSAVKTPIDFFYLFFIDELIDTIVIETNTICTIRRYYIPGETICIDETMMPWRGV